MSERDRPADAGRTIPRAAGRPIGVGIQLPEVEREVRWPELRAIARPRSRSASTRSGWATTCCTGTRAARPAGHGRRGRPSAALAEATERVALGPLVAASAFHAPFMLAKQAATVDEVSGGRLVLGLGAGWNEMEFAALGAPFDHRISRFEEAFTVVRTLLAEGAIDFDGRTSRPATRELLPRPARPGGPLLLIGSSGPRMLAATAAVRRRVERLVRGHRQLAGRRRAAARDGRRGRRAAGPRARRDRAHRRRPGADARRHRPDHGRHRSQAGVPPLEGPPEAIAEALRGYAREGIGHVQLVVDPITEASVAALAPALEALDRQ